MNSEVVSKPLSLPADLSTSAEEAEGGLNVSQLARTLRRKWPVIFGVALVTTAAAGAKVLTDTPVYSSTLEILVQPLSAETEVISNIPETLTSNSQDPTSTLSPDLLKILTSPSVLAPVIDEVTSLYPQFCAWPGVGTPTPPVVDVPTEGQVGEQAGGVNSYCYYVLRQNLSVNAAGENSNIIQAVYESEDPQQAQSVVEAISDAYLEYSLATRQADISRGIDFVDQKLPDLQQKVNTFQERLQQLRLDNDLIDPASRGSQISGQMSAFTQEQKEIDVALKQNREIYADLQRQLQQPGETSASSALSDNPRYQTLLNSLLNVDSQIAELSTLYRENSPDIEVLREQRENLVGLLNQQARQSEQETLSTIRELEARDRALRETIQGLNTDVDDLSGISRDYTDIQRELQVATDNLTQFLAKKEALEIDAAQREIPWEVVTPPTEPVPLLDNLPQNLLIGGVLGLLLGAATALLLDKSGGVIYSDEEIRRTTRLPVLGRIPRREVIPMSLEQSRMAESLQEVGAEEHSRSNGGRVSALVRDRENGRLAYGDDPFSESFRSLYTNLRLINSEKPVRSVAVSSAMPSEGKSTVALHLAQAAAAMGQRVLLVDADLRNPQVHDYLGISNEIGLTNLFSGESNPALIQKFSPEPNLYVIAAGSAPFEPARLFSSRSMKRFTEKVRKTFDLVIYDTPPLLGQSDAYIVANHADGLLLVTQPGKIKQPLLDRAMEQLQLADIEVLGLVTRE